MKVVAALLLALPLIAGAASPPPVKTAVRGTPIPVDAAKGAQLIKFAKLFSDTPDARIGTLRIGYFCKESGEFRMQERLTRYLLGQLRDALHREFGSAGYPKAPSSAFEQESVEASVEYQLGLNLVDAQLELCFNEDKAEGGLWMKAAIELYAPRERKVVFRGTYEGHNQTASGTWVKVEDMYATASNALVRNLLADPKFVEHATRRAEAPAADSGLVAMRLLRKQVGKGNATLQMPIAQSAVSTVFSGSGSGSGFLVSADGYWLTNRHVVGDAKYVKLRMANGREVLGEVLRSDTRRDVALLKSEAVALAPLEIAEAEPSAGSEVYAIGSPLGEKLEGTVTRGVVSSVREVEGQRYLQSDVKVLPGSSGGPLLDARGGVVGLTSGGIGGIATSMNLFIPVREALTVLKLEFQ